MEERNPRQSGRRSFLKTAGLATAGLATGVVGAVNGQGLSDTELYERSYEIQERAGWDLHQWRHWLAKHGIEFKYMDLGVPTPGPGGMNAKSPGQADQEDGVSSDRLDANETWHYMTYTKLNGVDRFRFDWSLNDGWDDSGESPVDWPGMSFEDAFYNFDNDHSPKTGAYVSNSGRADSWGTSYRTFKYDEDSHAFNTTGRFGSYFDVPLYVQDYDSSTRQIYTRYHHAWDSVKVDSIGVDSEKVVTVNFAKTTKRWVTTAFCEENEMDNGSNYVDKDPHIST